MNSYTVRDVANAQKTGEFLSGLVKQRPLTRLSKSKLSEFHSCPRKYWYSHVLYRKGEYTSEMQKVMQVGKYVHAVSENFFKYAHGRYDRFTLEGEMFIDTFFNSIINLNDDLNVKRHISNLCNWEKKKLHGYNENRRHLPVQDPFFYAMPVQLLDDSLAVEVKIYNERLDRVGIVDQAFWIPEKGKNEIMLVELKTGKHNPYRYTDLRKELTFLYLIAKESGLFPIEPKYGAVLWTDSLDVMRFKIGARQIKAVNDSIKKIEAAYESDIWKMNPGTDLQWSPCSFCNHPLVCPMEYNNPKLKFNQSLMEL